MPNPKMLSTAIEVDIKNKSDLPQLVKLFDFEWANPEIEIITQSYRISYPAMLRSLIAYRIKIHSIFFTFHGLSSPDDFDGKLDVFTTSIEGTSINILVKLVQAKNAISKTGISFSNFDTIFMIDCLTSLNFTMPPKATVEITLYLAGDQPKKSV